ncbi:hypothetical protein HUJ04_009629 [Dendroctonus ponderosae]|nr:hypothetical protein HUJ04_009629 [Dendroctonus ponderosae]
MDRKGLSCRQLARIVSYGGHPSVLDLSIFSPRGHNQCLHPALICRMHVCPVNEWVNSSSFAFTAQGPAWTSHSSNINCYWGKTTIERTFSRSNSTVISRKLCVVSYQLIQTSVSRLNGLTKSATKNRRIDKKAEALSCNKSELKATKSKQIDEKITEKEGTGTGANKNMERHRRRFVLPSQAERHQNELDFSSPGNPNDAPQRQANGHLRPFETSSKCVGHWRTRIIRPLVLDLDPTMTMLEESRRKEKTGARKNMRTVPDMGGRAYISMGNGRKTA